MTSNKNEQASDARFVLEHGVEAFEEALEGDYEDGAVTEAEYARRRAWAATLKTADPKVVSLDGYRQTKAVEASRIAAVKARAQAAGADPYGALLDDLYATLEHAARIIERERSKPRDAS